MKENAGDWSGGVGIGVCCTGFGKRSSLHHWGKRASAKEGAPPFWHSRFLARSGGVEEVMVSCQAVKEEPFQYSTPRFICDFYLRENGSICQRQANEQGKMAY